MNRVGEVMALEITDSAWRKMGAKKIQKLESENAALKARWERFKKQIENSFVLNRDILIQSMQQLESGDSEDISLCKSCGCMTHTAENNICGKCEKIKPDCSEGDKK